jgi:Putative methyltransferase
VCQHIQQGWDSQKNHNQGNNEEGEGTTCHDDDVISGYWKDYVLYSTNIDPFPHSDIHHTHTFQGQYDHSATTSTPNLYEARAPYSNLRIHAGDGFKLLPKIPSDSLACILVTFPDPFPKEEQKQWRLIQVHTLLQFHRILRKAIIKQDDPTDDGLPVDTGENLHLPATLFLGHYFYLATDHSGYFDWVHETMQRLNSTKTYFRLIDPCPDRMGWLPAVSTYEQKGWREGRRTHMACWEAVEENA